MPRMKKVEIDPEMFEGMNETELKDAIVKNVKRMKQLKLDLKAFRTNINEQVAELDARNEAALDELAHLKGEAPLQ